MVNEPSELITSGTIAPCPATYITSAGKAGAGGIGGEIGAVGEDEPRPHPERLIDTIPQIYNTKLNRRNRICRY